MLALIKMPLILVLSLLLAVDDIIVSAVTEDVTDAIATVVADAITTLWQHHHHLKENNHSQMYSQDNFALDGVTAANSHADLVAVTPTLAIEWQTG